MYNLKKHQEIGCIYIHTTDYPMHTWAPEDAKSKEHLLKLDYYISEASWRFIRFLQHLVYRFKTVDNQVLLISQILLL